MQRLRQTAARLIALCAALLLCALSSIVPAHADTRIALVVANSDYLGAKLSNPGVDLELIVPALEALGFEVTPVRDADLLAFDTALSDFAERAKAADVALFYFAGHGFAVNDGINVRNYLMSTSADVAAPSDRVIRAGGIALDEIIEQLGVAKTALIFVDACRNDPRVQRGQSSRGLAPIDRGNAGSIFVGLSTRIGDTAADGVPGEGSPFARAFVDNIGQVNMRVDDAFTRIRLAVERETSARQRPDVGLYELDEPVILQAAEPNGPPQSTDVAAIPEVETPLVEANSGKATPSLKDSAFCQDLDPQTRSQFLLCHDYETPTAAEIPVQPCDTLASTAEGMFVDYFSVEPDKAIPACEAAVREFPNVARFSFQLGRAYHVGELYRKALTAYVRAAELGNAEAMTIIGQFYADGIVEDRNCIVARDWLIRATKAGDASRGLRGLGNLYTLCPGFENPAQATEFFLLSLLYGNDETLGEVGGTMRFSTLEAATRLQSFLSEHGFYSGPVDGEIGAETIKAAEAAYFSIGDPRFLQPGDTQIFERLLAQR